MDKTKLHDYFLELKKEFEKEKIPNSTILQTATSFLIHENISAEKKQSQQQSAGDMMTERQRNYLEQEKVKIPEEGFTKMEASKLIGEIIERKKKSKSQEQNPEDYGY